jgi:integrase
LAKAVCAALSLASKSDPTRITNRDAWRIGLGSIAESFRPRNHILTDAEVTALVLAARAQGEAWGLYVECHAVTGARSSQLAALQVSDLQANQLRLMLPGSRKGKNRVGGVRRPIPLGTGLASRLQQAARGRPPSAPLLLRPDGTRWRPERGDHARLFARTAKSAGIDCTIYALRHSSIVRSLLAGTPLRVVAVNHDTSAVVVERVYSAFIGDHSDAVARLGLLDISPAPEGKVVALRP